MSVRTRLSAGYALCFVVLGLVLVLGNYIVTTSAVATHAADPVPSEVGVNRETVLWAVENGDLSLFPIDGTAAGSKSKGKGSDDIDTYVLFPSAELVDVQGQSVALAGQAAQQQSLASTRVEVLWGSLAALGITALLALILGSLMARRALRPVRAVADTARIAGESDLSTRIEVPETRDEIRDLVTTFNEMLARLEGAFNSQRRFVAHASHELRTPLTSQRLLLDVAADERERGIPYDADLIDQLRQTVDQQARTLDGLLVLAQSDAGLTTFSDIPLHHIVTEAVRGIAPQAEARDVTIDVAIPQGIQVWADRPLLEVMVNNLIRNAVRHNVTGGRVEIAAAEVAGRTQLTIQNTCDPVAPELLEHLRASVLDDEPSSTNHHGLGLMIVGSAARIIDATVQFDVTAQFDATAQFDIPSPTALRATISLESSDPAL